MNIPQRWHPSSAGFTLIEVIIVIAMLAVMAGAMAPLAVRMIDSGRQDATLERQKSIYRSILGDPSAPGSGFIASIFNSTVRGGHGMARPLSSGRS
jgi:prepilin-type N-terminal cleavage/methylation domain-containing protein